MYSLINFVVLTTLHLTGIQNNEYMKIHTGAY